MSFVDLFSPENVLLDLRGEGKSAVLEELVERLVATKTLPKTRRKQALEALALREELGSTGIGHGVGIPHAKIEGLKKVHTCIGLHRSGVEYGAVDGEPVHIIMMILRPNDDAQKHLGFLQWISKLGRNPDFRSFIRQARTEKEVVAVLEEMS